MKKESFKPDRGRKLKGQFFLVAGLLLLLLFFAGLPKSTPLAQTPTVEDLGRTYENIESEFTRALTLGLNTSAQIDTLKNFTVFVNDMLAARYITFGSLWVVSQGNTSNIINVSVGNFLLYDTNVTLNMTRDSGISTIRHLYVPQNKENSTEFSSVTSEFNLTIAFNSDSSTVEWERDKVNIYALVNLSRTGSIKKEEYSF